MTLSAELVALLHDTDIRTARLTSIIKRLAIRMKYEDDPEHRRILSEATIHVATSIELLAGGYSIRSPLKIALSLVQQAIKTDEKGQKK